MRIPFTTGTITFRIDRGQQLSIAVILKGSALPRTVGTCRQQPLPVPGQCHRSAQRIGHAVRQALLRTGVVITRRVPQCVRFLHQPVKVVVQIQLAAAIRIRHLRHVIRQPVPLVLGFPAQRVSLTEQTTVAVPRGLATRTAGQNDLAQLAIAVTLYRFPPIVIGKADDLIVFVQFPLCTATVIPARRSAPPRKVILQRKLLARTVAVCHHAGQIRYLPPRIFAEQAVGVFMAGHQPIILPGKTAAHATAPPGDGDQLPLRVVGIVHQTRRRIQPDALQPPITIPACHLPVSTVLQCLKRAVRIPGKEDVIATRVGDT